MIQNKERKIHDSVYLACFKLQSHEHSPMSTYAMSSLMLMNFDDTKNSYPCTRSNPNTEICIKRKSFVFTLETHIESLIPKEISGYSFNHSFNTCSFGATGFVLKDYSETES